MVIEPLSLFLFISLTFLVITNSWLFQIAFLQISMYFPFSAFLVYEFSVPTVWNEYPMV